MRIYAFTDPHGNEKALAHMKRAVKKEKPAVLICCGDLTVFENNMTKLLKELDKLNVPTIMLHGNHEEERLMRKACKKTKNIMFLHKAIKKIGGYTFAAFGGGGFDDKYPELETQLKKWKNLEWEKTVFLSHAPPYNTTLDDVGEPGDPWHVGSKTLRKLIRKKKPLLTLVGHIHDCFNKVDTINKAPVENPGPSGKLYDLKELEKKR